MLMRREKKERKKRRKVQKVKQPRCIPGSASYPFPTLNTALSQSNLLARDSKGWCCTGFGKNSMAASQGFPIEPCCVVQGHCASLHMHRSLREVSHGSKDYPIAMVLLAIDLSSGL